MTFFYENNLNIIKNISDNEKKLIVTMGLQIGISKDNLNQKKNITKNEKIIYFYKSFLDVLVEYLIKKYEEIDVAIDILLFISSLANEDENMKNILEKNQEFFVVLKKIINLNSVYFNQ